MEDFIESDVNNLVEERVKDFLSISQNKKYKKFYTMVIVFLNNEGVHYEETLIKVHTNYKRKLIYEGLLVGEFYPTNFNHGLYNKEFFPLKSEIPMLAIRYLIEDDLPEELKRDFIEGYLETLGDSISRENFNIAQSHLQKVTKKDLVYEKI